MKDRDLIIIGLIFVVVMHALFIVAGIAHAEPMPRLYDTLSYADRPDASTFMEPANNIYANNIWDEGGVTDRNALPNADHIRKLAESLPTDRPTWLNIEHRALGTTYSSASDEQVRENHAWIMQIIAWFREGNPNLRLGIYSMVPTPLPGSINSQRHLDAIEVDVERVRETGLADAVDFFAPSLYVRYDETYEQWEERARRTLDLCRRLDPTKPVLPFIWNRYHGSHSNPELREQIIPADFFGKQADYLLRHADGAFVWGGWLHGREAWGPEHHAWFDRLREVEHRYRIQWLYERQRETYRLIDEYRSDLYRAGDARHKQVVRAATLADVLRGLLDDLQQEGKH